jgi:voltage-gated potassium channel
MPFDRRSRFVILLVAILVELMLAPLFAGSESGLRVAQGLAIVVMVAALWAAGGRRASIVLFVPTFAAHLLVSSWGSTPIHVLDLVLRSVFFGYTTGLIVWSTMRRSEVTIDTIAGAACAYTLLAVVWANFYALLEVFHPGSFNIPAAWLLGPTKDPTAGLVYFSFVTLTTVGYGDVTPQWPGAGGLAMTEAIVGQLYLAITIARLVGLHASRRLG